MALVGGLFSFLYNHYQSQREETAKSNQAELQKIETVSKFMVYLAGDDERVRTVALFEVQHILDTKAALLLAKNVNTASSGNVGLPSGSP